MTLFDTPSENPPLKRIEYGLPDELAGLVHHYGFDEVEASLGRIKVQMSGPVSAAPARDGDPRTSKAAAKTTPDIRRFGTNSYSGKLLRHFEETSLTDYQATLLVVGPPGVDTTVSVFEGCRRRCSDLRAAGYIADAGIERDGRIVWTITPEGEEALYRMKLSGWSR
ncbi:MAG: hypothetical protein MUP76_04580 [Acidimicrobiia bacterium]|nr:hypothetical protein [Acidimicrobiia bacterium]